MTLLATLAIDDTGRARLTLPDSPLVGEGPTGFTVEVPPGQLFALVEALPGNAAARIRELVRHRAEALDDTAARDQEAAEASGAARDAAARLMHELERTP